MPKLSVIVPFYGVEDYLGECLDSILAQTFTDFECILVDDGSKDRSIDVAREYERRDPRVHVVQQDNQGLGPARNTGVRHAQGEYLMFVDSDDLLIPRAFSRLVGSLETTGSDIAVGNAWRFSRDEGLWPSWTHTLPCEVDRQRTHVNEFPALIRDRMAWNKVFRRSFWDAHGYEFPAIRYEDYPVTLKAHLDASAVDIIAERVYLWRDRETGQSITQQANEARNADDRARSASMVLDLLDTPGVSDTVREDTHAYLIDVDLLALAGALLHASWADRAHLETVIGRLARRLRPQAPGRLLGISEVVHAALRRDDFDVVRALVSWRTGEHAPLRAVLSKRPDLWPSVLIFSMTKRRIPALGPTRPLEVWLTGAVEEAGRFVFNTELKLRARFYLTAKVSVVLKSANRTVPVICEPARRVNSLKVRILVAPDDILALEGEDAVVEVSARYGPLHWKGAVTVPDASELPPVLPLQQGYWTVARLAQEPTLLPLRGALPGTIDQLRVTVVHDPVVAEGQKVSENVAELRLTRPSSLVIARPRPTGDVQLPEGMTARLDAAEVTDNDPPDDPVTRSARRPIRTDRDEPIYVSRFPGAIRADGVQVRVVPNWRGEAQLLVEHTSIG